MPEKKTIQRSRKKAQQGRAPSTQAGEFVREEFEHIRHGKHGARSPKQAIAIGLSKARKAGVKLPSRGRKKASSSMDSRTSSQSSAQRASQRPSQRPSKTRSQAISRVLRS